jgi:hypothetical protein
MILHRTFTSIDIYVISIMHAGSIPPRSDLHAVVVEPLHPTVPLSSIPCAALGVATAEEKAKASHACSQESAALSAGSSISGALSQLKEKEKAKAEDLKLRFNRPRQVGFRVFVEVSAAVLAFIPGVSLEPALERPRGVSVCAAPVML